MISPFHDTSRKYLIDEIKEQPVTEAKQIEEKAQGLWARFVAWLKAKLGVK